MNLNNVVKTKDVEDIIRGLREMIRAQKFLLSESDLSDIGSKVSSELVDGWIFAYKAYSSSETRMHKLLKSNIYNSNPRIREQVCDIIGDECIVDLRSELKNLFSDPIPYVAEAAKYNHDNMF